MIKPRTKQGYIILVEDDELSAELLESYLFSYGYAVTVLPDGEPLADTLREQLPDAVLLDILLPGKDGLHWLAWINTHYPQLPVLLCSRKSESEDRVIGLGKGARDYIIKPYHPREVLLRLKNVIGESPRPLERVGSLQFDAKRAALTLPEDNGESIHISLTLHESLLLQLFFQKPGMLVSRDDIAEWLHGNGYDPNKRGIDMLMARLRKKLGDTSEMPRYLHTVWGKGYRFTPEG